MPPTAVILSAVILSLSVLSTARLYPSTAVKLRGPHDPAVNSYSHHNPTLVTVNGVHNYTDAFNSRHVSFRPVRVRCGDRHVIGWGVGPRSGDHAVSRDEFRMRVQRLAVGTVGDGAFRVGGYTNGFGSNKDGHHRHGHVHVHEHEHEHGHGHGHGHGQGHGHGVGGGFVERVWEFLNRF